MSGASRVSGNQAREGGGVYGKGTLTMNGASSISDNDVRNFDDARNASGSGVRLDGGTLTMNDRSAIRGNRWNGVYVEGGTVVMNDHSSIRDTVRGGGIGLDGGTLTMNDYSTVTRNAIRPGTPAASGSSAAAAPSP